MCGIVGVFARDGAPLLVEGREDLVDHLAHRGPDEGAFWAAGPFFLGHRRLAILDLATGGQPLATEDGTLAVTFNGEIYNHRELRAELERAGHRFRTASDTEVLLHGWRQWGRRLPERLTGMFAFAIADVTRRELFLARDRFGEKPLLVLETPGQLAFASELRPLTALAAFARRVNEAALGRYLLLGYVPGTETLAAGVARVAPASWRLYSERSVEEAVYWRPAATAGEVPADAAAAQAELGRRLDRAVKLALVSDVPVGVWLSGGMDSSLVAESARRSGTLDRAYVLDMPDARYSERGAAEVVARRLGLPLEVVPLAPPSGEDLVALAEHGDDPNADSSSYAVRTLARSTGGRHKVVLGGDGGDEVFGGYLTYSASRLHARAVSPLPRVLRRALRAFGERLPTSEAKVSFSYKLRRFLRAAPLETREAHFAWNGSFLPDDAARLCAKRAARRAARAGLAELARRHALDPRPPLGALQRADASEYLPNDILAKVDRMSMAHGVEVRAPFLEHELAAWGLGLPDGLKLSRDGELKSVLRARARAVFGPEVADRPKQGFSIPVHAWVRGPLREAVTDLLAPASLAATGLLDAAAVGRVLRDHMTGRRSFGFELWTLAILVAWHRARIQRAPSRPRASPLVDRSPSRTSPARPTPRRSDTRA